MATYVVRVWLPDRPGALGAVASRIGAVQGDLVGVDILERGGGRAIDELVVVLPDDEALVPLLVAEMSEVDGVAVEDVRLAAQSVVDPRLAALETATLLVEQVTVAALLRALAEHELADLQADWCAVVDLRSPGPVVSVGEVPPSPWLGAFIAGSRASGGSAGDEGPEDVAWAELSSAGLVILLGRRGRPLRTGERRQLSALSRIADHRWTELSTRSARLFHPSAAL